MADKKTTQKVQDAKREALITGLLTYSTVKQASKAAKVSERTAYRWLKEPDFVEDYRQARRQVFTHSLGRLQKLTVKAIENLEKILDDTQECARTKVTAARTVLENAVRAVELEDFDVRIEKIEKLLETRIHHD